MTSIRRITCENGQVWAVCAGCLVSDHGCVAIPIDQLEDLSNEDIGLRVQQLERDARLLKTEVLADYIDAHNIYRVELDELMNWHSRLREFEKDNDEISNALKYVNEEIDRRWQRDKARRNKTKKRNQIKSDYEKLFVQIGRRDGFACSVCESSASDLQIDHIIPLAENGANDLGNLQLLCPACNQKKSDNT